MPKRRRRAPPGPAIAPPPRPRPAAARKEAEQEDLADILGIRFDTLDAFRRDVERNLLADGEIEYDPIFTRPVSVRVLPCTREAWAAIEARWPPGARHVIIHSL